MTSDSIRYTPLPWRVSEIGDYNSVTIRNDPPLKKGLKYDKEIAALSFRQIGELEVRANAEYIVRAVNSHNELVEQCELFERTILYEIKNSTDKEGARLKTITLNLLRATLAKARKEPQ